MNKTIIKNLLKLSSANLTKSNNHTLRAINSDIELRMNLRASDFAQRPSESLTPRVNILEIDSSLNFEDGISRNNKDEFWSTSSFQSGNIYIPSNFN